MILDDPKYSDYKIHIVFANTGREREETLQFVNECDKRWGLGVVWVEAVINPEHGKGTTHKIVSFETATRGNALFVDMIKKYGISNKAFPHCTRELKLRPIASYMKSLGIKGYLTAIGIRLDEQKRLLSHGPDVISPLLEKWVVERNVLDYWREEDFDLGLKRHEGNCDLCWKKSIRKKVTLIREKPWIATAWVDMEDEYAYDETTGEYYYFHQGNLSTRQLIEMAADPSIKSYTDDYQYNKEMDSEAVCNCSINMGESNFNVLDNY
jgi:hypothetical protein